MPFDPWALVAVIHRHTHTHTHCRGRYGVRTGGTTQLWSDSDVVVPTASAHSGRRRWHVLFLKSLQKGSSQLRCNRSAETAPVDTTSRTDLREVEHWSLWGQRVKLRPLVAVFLRYVFIYCMCSFFFCCFNIMETLFLSGDRLCST